MVKKINALDFGMVPPQAIEFEEVVLGSMIMENDIMTDVMDIITGPQVFYKEAHQKICQAIYDLFAENKQIDLLTVTEKLRVKGELDEVGGAFYVTQLGRQVGGTGHVQEHSAIIQEKYIRRELIRQSNEVTIKAYDESIDLEDLLIYASKESADISDGLYRSVGMEMPEAVEMTSEMVKKVNAGHPEHAMIPTGFKRIDHKLGGFMPTDLIIVAARPSMGKTSLALNIAENVASMHNMPVGIFSLEMSTIQLTQKLISGKGEFNNAHFKSPMTRDILEKYVEASEYIAKLGIIIDDNPRLNHMQFTSKARKMVRKYGVKLIIVDYIQLMSGTGEKRGVNREQEVSDISRHLKIAAKELNVPVIALSQMSRQVESRVGTKYRPVLSDLRESGCLHGDTKIYCPHLKNNVRIEDLVYQKDFHIFATDLINNKVMKANKCFSTGKKEVFEMILLNGQKIRATANHKFLTSDGWMELKDISNYNVAIPIDIENEESNIKDSEIRLLGHFLSNGTCLKKHAIQVTINQNDLDLADIIMKDAINCTDNKVIPRILMENFRERSRAAIIFFKPAFHLTHGKTSPIADIMRKYNLFDVRGKQKFIPEEMFFISKRQINILLSSLFTGDGTVYYQEAKGRKSLKISYSSASWDLISGIQQLLLNVGIVSFISNVENKKSQKWFNLYISGKSNIELFVKNIGFLSKRKNDIMLNGWEKSKNNLAGWNKYQYNENRTLCFMPIKEIKSIGIHEVYDIEVDKLHNFFANGMVVHNSIEQDADMVLFLYCPSRYGIHQDEDGKSLTGLTEIIVAKNRNGAIFSEYLGFIKEYTKFVDPEEMKFTIEDLSMTPNKDFEDLELDLK